MIIIIKNYWIKTRIFNNLDKKYLSTKSKIINKKKSNLNQLGYYLGGLIEGDGSIIVPESIRNNKGILLYPNIKITFVKKDLPLAKKLIEIIKSGTLEEPKNKNYIHLWIRDSNTLCKVAVMINSKMRTSKIEAFHRLIDWLNNT